jgi:PPE-repeat protein
MFSAMEFTTLPPEITSALIHTGPGAESLIAASAAWQQLGTTLEDSAENYGATLSSLTGTWHGPSSATMVQAVEPYVTWLRATAQQTQQIASSAQAAAAAYNSARASVVPPAEVTANRTRLVQLLATNGFGRNLPAIAETEAEYQSMWANNSAAMSRYQAASAQASTLPQFASPTSATNPTRLATQGSAVPAATTSSTASKAPTVAAATPAAALPTDFDPSVGVVGEVNTYLNQFISSGFPINMLSYLAQNQSAQALQGVNAQIGQGVSEGEGALGGGAAGGLGALGQGGLGALGGGASGGFGGISQVPTAAATGVGVSIGKLTAPPAVVNLLPTSQAPVQLASAASPLSGGESGLPTLPPLMPPPVSAGSGWRKRKQPKYEDIAIGAELKGKVIHPPPSAG